MKRVLALFLAVATVWTGMPVSTVLAQENVTEQSEESVAKEVTTEEATTTEETATSAFGNLESSWRLSSSLPIT